MRPSTPFPTALNRTKSTITTLVAALGWLLSRLVAAAGLLAAAIRRLLGTARGVAAWTEITVRRLVTRVDAVLRGPVARLARGPLWTLVIGRRPAVSVVLVCLAPVLAAVAAWVASATVGYPPLQRWLVGTWTGSDPRAVVFLGVALLVGLAAASAATNAGLLPTTLLAAAPLFGMAMTRYGAVVTTGYGQYTVSLPDAVAFALAVAVVGGISTALVGYGLGAGLRRAAGVVRADPAAPFGARNDE
ncbi:hypothetical protein [Haloplanus pelagicus]|jgi:hypothetical protein|uniref:hypothetical protein n=1 Tax=Haloplanus pelagicus TaxID=2949995 RepID=UPI00204087CE|nr:hypothetical protein [Haloplanus sp. HW8-1]